MSDHANRQRLPAEIVFEEELARLQASDSARRPPGWLLSPLAVERFILGGVFIFAWYTRECLRRLSDLGPLAQAGITMLAAGYVSYVVFALALPLGLAEFRFDATPDALLLLAWVCIGGPASSPRA